MATWKVILIAGAAYCVGIFGGVYLTHDEPKIVTKTVTKKVYVEQSTRDVSTKACIAAGGVPTYSAWDGGLNGCIQVGQASRDTSKP